MKNKIEEIRSDLANSQNEKEDLKEKYEKDLGKNGKKDESNNAALLKVKQQNTSVLYKVIAMFKFCSNLFYQS